MEDDDLIHRQKDKKDGRLVKICLTKLGIKKKKIAKRVVREFNEFVIQRIQPEHLNSYYQVMNDILNLTEEYRTTKLPHGK